MPVVIKLLLFVHKKFITRWKFVFLLYEVRQHNSRNYRTKGCINISLMGKRWKEFKEKWIKIELLKMRSRMDGLLFRFFYVLWLLLRWCAAEEKKNKSYSPNGFYTYTYSVVPNEGSRIYWAKVAWKSPIGHYFVLKRKFCVRKYC